MDSNFKSFYRAFKLKLLEDNLDISIVKPKTKLFGFLYPGSRTVKYLFKNGAVLVGSRALNQYRLNGKPLLNRRPDDWDFEITKEMFNKLCYDYDYDMKRIKNDHGFIRWNLIRSLMASSDGYGGTDYMFPHYIHLIIKEEMVKSVDIGKGWAVPSLDYLISQKYKYGDQGDLKYIHQKFNYVV